MKKSATFLIVTILLITLTLNVYSQKEKLKSNDAKSREKQLSVKTRDSLKNLTDLKINELKRFLDRIADKSKSYNSRVPLINDALQLFLKNGENCFVEVTSLNQKGKKQRYKTRLYLNNLANLLYEKVTLEWYEINYVPKLTLRPDGKYEGVVTLYQKFTGKGKSKEFPDYVDVTKKNIQIIFEPQKAYKGDKVMIIWKAFLGDISVAETASTLEEIKKK
jgi:hypothetical protein